MALRGPRTRKATTTAGILGGLLISIFGFGGSAQAALLDANCPGPPSGAGVTPGAGFYAQTFTAQHTGTVVQAQTAVSNQAGTGDFLLKIFASGASGPINGALGQATVPGASAPVGVTTTISGTFNSPAPVVAGQQYALVIQRPSGNWTLRDRNTNPCPGSEFYSAFETGPWTPETSQYDFVYSIFVDPTNEFTVGKLKGRSLLVTVPGPGEVSVSNAGGGGKSAIASAKKLLKTSKKTAAAAGQVKLKLKLTKAATALLNEKGKLKLKAAISFTPTGGVKKTVNQKLKLK